MNINFNPSFNPLSCDVIQSTVKDKHVSEYFVSYFAEVLKGPNLSAAEGQVKISKKHKLENSRSSCPTCSLDKFMQTSFNY